MAKYKSANGKIIDMSALAAKNERTRAVGNMKVNARGDTIDDRGRIIVPVTQKVGENYQRTVGNRSAQPVRTSQSNKINQTVNTKPAKVEEVEELTPDEQNLELESAEELEIEKLKAQETKK